LIQYGLRSSISDVKNPVATETVMNRESDSNERDVPAPSQVVALAVPDEEVGIESFGLFGYFVEIHALSDDGRFDVELLQRLLNGYLEKARAGAGGAKDRLNANLCKERCQAHHEVCVAINNRPFPGHVLVAVHERVD
jgi:hypothetical protein